MLGVVYAFLSAASFAFNNASTRRGVITASVFQALAVTVPIGVPLFALAALLTGQLGAIGRFSWGALGALALAGMLHFVWGRYCGYRSIKAMGSNLAAPIQNANLVVSLGLAVVLLGETLTPLKIAGITLIFIGPAIAVPTRGKKPAKKDDGDDKPGDGRPVFQPKLVEGYTWGVLSASGYGLSPVLVRVGLEGSGAPLAGGLVSYAAATALFCLLLIPPGQLAHIRLVDRKALPWFVNSGVFVFLAQMFRYLALAIAPVTVISPIQRTSGIFRIIFSTLLNRDYEVLNTRLIAGILLSVIGAVMLTISVDFVAETLSIPPGWLDWQWP